jgi:peptidoglycan/LPS O-acetylase OafA/YrhL
MFQHTWTLAIEEQFYLLWPLLLCRAGRRTLAATVVTFAALPPLGRALGYSPFLLLTRCDGLAFGSLLALLVFDRGRVTRHLGAFRLGFAAVGLAALVLPELADTSSLDPALFTTRACLVYFGLSGLVLCTQGHPVTFFLRDRRLCYIGTVSYGLYLYHPMVFAALPGPYKRLVFRRLGLTSTLLMDLTMLAVCFVLAELSRRYLEGPILALKERLTYRTAGLDPALYGVVPSPAEPSYRGPHPPAAARPVPEDAARTAAPDRGI